jgi:hypothetical protein
MALEGNLSAFGLSEILQLIAVQQKTGMLTVNRQHSSAVLFFRDGKIVSTRDRRRKAKDPFKEYLTRYGVLNREELIKITQISSQSKLDLVDILGSEGFMSEQELRGHFVKQIQETLHEVLTWDQCSYKFISNKDVVDSVRTIGEFSIEGMLMESMRRIDEFPQMLELFPDEQVLIKRTSNTEDADYSDVSSNEKTVLSFLDEGRSLRVLISRAGMPRFEVYESLKLLREKDLIETNDDQVRVLGDDDRESATSRRLLRKRGNPLPFAAALLFFGATLFLGVRGFVDNLDEHRTALVESIESNSIARNQVGENLRWVIEGYRVQYGVYPPSLGALEEAGLVSPRLVRMTELFSFRYQLTPGRPAYTLL